MMQLIKLELMKNKLRGTLIAFLSITFSVIGISILGAYSELLEEGLTIFKTPEELFMLGGVAYRVCFVIFSGVMIGQLIIEEFKTGTVKALFTYPISRKKIIAAKLLLIFLLTAAGYFLAKMIYVYSMVLINPLISMIPSNLTADMALAEIPVSALEALAVSGMGFLALYFGMKKKSPTHAIIAACIIGTLLNSNFGNNYTLFQFTLIPVLFCLAGIGTAMFTCRSINRIDI